VIVPNQATPHRCTICAQPITSSGKVFHFSRIAAAAKVLNQNIFRRRFVTEFSPTCHTTLISRGEPADRLGLKFKLSCNELVLSIRRLMQQ
jgi:hypothetical protein